MRKMISTLAAATAATLVGMWFLAGSMTAPGPDITVELASLPQAAEIRLPGEYLLEGRAIDAPKTVVALNSGAEIMTYPVSLAEYGLCVEAGACAAPEAVRPGDAARDVPVTGVNYSDAIAYAEWLSKLTGENWRLPTDAEWVAAAAERMQDDGLNLSPEENENPAARWLEQYRSEAARGRDMEPKPIGHFGRNSRDLVDIGGNVWEWTSTCYTRTTLDAEGEILYQTENCGVRVVGGKHRGYMSHFVRDGKSGGCAAGLPPDNLGIRLVRERTSFAYHLRKFWKGATS